MWQNASGITQKIFSPVRYGQFSRGCLDTLAVTCQQLPLHESKCLNRQMRGQWICQRSLYKVSYRSSWQKINTDFLKKRLKKKNPFLKEEAKVIKSHLKISSLQIKQELGKRNLEKMQYSKKCSSYEGWWKWFQSLVA